MTNTIWSNPVSDDWSNAADWSAGLPNAGEDAIFNATGAYKVTITSAAIAHALYFDASHATLLESSTGSLSLTGGLTLDAGTVVLNGVNNFGGPSRLVNGTLELGNGAALGSSDLTIGNGTLIGTTNEIIANDITADGAGFTFAAAHGHSVQLTGNVVLDMNHDGGTINFGKEGDDGVVVWAAPTLGIAQGLFSVNVKAGTLRDGNGSLGELLSNASAVVIAQSGEFDLQGKAYAIPGLAGNGIVESTAAGGVLTLHSGGFGGTITGDLSLIIAGNVSLSGTNTYTGHTTINSGHKLFVTDGGSIAGGVTIQNGSTLDLTNGGTVNGPVLDNGIVLLDSTTIAASISGTGSVQISETATLSNSVNTYSGGTMVTNSTVNLDNATLGTGIVTLLGGTLIATGTESLDNDLDVLNSDNIAAASGKTLTVEADTNIEFSNNGASLTFGDPTNNGVIVWNATNHIFSSGRNFITINGGTLRAAGSHFQTLLNLTATPGNNFVINGTLDVAGYSETIHNLSGSGTIANSGASAAVTIYGGSFYGDFSGPIVLNVMGGTQLGGDAANWSVINDLGNLSIVGPSSADIVFSASKLQLYNPSEFTGSISNFDAKSTMRLDSYEITGVQYNGDTAGGTLTVLDTNGTLTSIHMIGDYTNGAFEIARGGKLRAVIVFVPNSSSSSAAHSSADTFDFGATANSHTAPALNHPQASIENSTAHDVTALSLAHDLAFDHFMHDFFVHHAMPEALI